MEVPKSQALGAVHAELERQGCPRPSETKGLQASKMLAPSGEWHGGRIWIYTAGLGI